MRYSGKPLLMKMHDQPVSMESAVNFVPRVLSISAACFSQGGAACFSMGRGEHPWFQPPPPCQGNALWQLFLAEKDQIL